MCKIVLQNFGGSARGGAAMEPVEPWNHGIRRQGDIDECATRCVLLGPHGVRHPCVTVPEDLKIGILESQGPRKSAFKSRSNRSSPNLPKK